MVDLIAFFAKALIENVWDVIKFVLYIAAILIFETLSTPLTIHHAHQRAMAEKEEVLE